MPEHRRPDVIINLPQPLPVVVRILHAMPYGSTVAPGERQDQMFVFFERADAEEGEDTDPSTTD